MPAARPLTPAEKKLARHALGLPNARGTSYRNRYVCAYQPGRALDAWERMEGAGMAFSKTICGERIVFHLTHAGALAALEDGERLDPENFPEAP